MCVCVINSATLLSLLGSLWVNADLHLLASCRPEEELWAGAVGAGGAPWTGSAAPVSPPRGHACCWGIVHVPHLHFCRCKARVVLFTYNFFYSLFLNNCTQLQFYTQRTLYALWQHFNINLINNMLLLNSKGCLFATKPFVSSFNLLNSSALYQFILFHP